MAAEPQEDWWASEIHAYLERKALLEDDVEAERVDRRSSLYELREATCTASAPTVSPCGASP